MSKPFPPGSLAHLVLGGENAKPLPLRYKQLFKESPLIVNKQAKSRMAIVSVCFFFHVKKGHLMLFLAIFFKALSCFLKLCRHKNGNLLQCWQVDLQVNF